MNIVIAMCMFGIMALSLVGVYAVAAWLDVQRRQLHLASRLMTPSELGLREAMDRVGKEGLACIDPTRAPHFVEQLGYTVLPRDKYIELLNVVRAAPAEEFDVDRFVADIHSWKAIRDGSIRNKGTTEGG